MELIVLVKSMTKLVNVKEKDQLDVVIFKEKRDYLHYKVNYVYRATTGTQRASWHFCCFLAV